MLSFAGYDISALVLEHFRLDGGAMFGSVPKTLWQKRIPADELNRIQLATRILLLKGHGHSVVVDLGCGDKFAAKERQIYAIEPQATAPLVERIAAARPDLGEVTDVILTHLHFDHAGGISTGETPHLTFPSARIHVQRTNYELACRPGPRERASYLAANVAPLATASLRLLEDGETILPAIVGHAVHGHTRGMQWIHIGTGVGSVAFAADLVPTAHHLPVPYVMGYDLCAATSIDEKEKFLAAAAREQWRVVFEHDADTPAATVAQDARGAYAVREVVHL